MPDFGLSSPDSTRIPGLLDLQAALQTMKLSQIASTSREIAAAANEALDFPETTRHLMRLIRGLVPCESINLGTIDLESEEGFHFSLDGFLMPAERRALLPHFKHQHPMLEHARRHGYNPPLRFTDFYSRRQFEERPLYRECYRGYTHSMLTFGVAAPPGLNVSFVLSREDKDFSDDDCQALAVLQPLIASVLHQRMLRDAYQVKHVNGPSTGVAYGIGPNLQVADTQAMELLQTHFPTSNRHRLSPALWTALLLQFGQVTPVKSFPEGGRLYIRIGPSLNAWRMEIWEADGHVPDNVLADFRLTNRQGEVARWLAMGKSNAEIALILGISARTVEKHLETIYRQLGVENRIAAMSLLHERMQLGS